MSGIMLVGEAYGKDEEIEGRPFVGASGRILNFLLAQAGIRRDECYLTNVFNLRPQPTNEVENLCGPKTTGIPGLPFLRPGKYIRAEYAPELDRLFREIETVRPTLIVALGASPAWALLGTSGIKSIRGAPAWSKRANCKVLPTYHPAAVMREWKLRPVVLADLDKAKREALFPEVRRPEREVYLEPNLSDLADFDAAYIRGCERLSIDIETKGEQITCIGFAPSKDRVLVVPFWDSRRPGGNYWATLKEELEAWAWVKQWCQYPCIFQNGMYDMHHLWRSYGIVCNATDDTMLLQHAEQPEMEKGLGFLGSIYTDEAPWKLMRNDTDTLKREE